MNYAISPLRLPLGISENKSKPPNQNIFIPPKQSSSKVIGFSGGIQQEMATKIANSIPDKFFQNRITQKILKLAQKDLALFDAFLTLVIVASIRPATIMITPGASKEDKQYAAVKAAAGGIIGLGLTALLFTPVTKAVQTVAKEVFKDNSAKSKSFEYIMNYGSKFIVAPLQAVLLVEMMHPLMDLVFPKKKGKKHKIKQSKQINNKNNQNKKTEVNKLVTVLMKAGKNDN